MPNDFLLTIYQLSPTVFTLKELTLQFSDISYPNLKNRLHYYVRTGKLQAVRRGVFAKPGYNLWELANKLYPPSYISLETVLQKEGMIFQVYDQTVFAVSYLTRDIAVDGRLISYRQIPLAILANPAGVDNQENCWVASRERAFLDAVFVYKNYYFDNLRSLDWEKVRQLQPLYASRALNRRVDQYYQSFQKKYA